MLLEVPLLFKEGAQSIAWEWIHSCPLWNSLSFWMLLLWVTTEQKETLIPLTCCLLHVVHDPGACDAQSLRRFPSPFNENWPHSFPVQCLIWAEIYSEKLGLDIFWRNCWKWAENVLPPYCISVLLFNLRVLALFRNRYNASWRL